MKIIVEEINNIKETEIIIKCKRTDDNVKSIVSSLKLFDNNISVKKDKNTYILSPKEIFYFDCVENKVFCYCEKEIYETNYRLYQLEELFYNTSFLRINKNIILNINKIKSFTSTINGRMEASLINGEKVEISRNYVHALKIKLGGKNR